MVMSNKELKEWENGLSEWKTFCLKTHIQALSFYLKTTYNNCNKSPTYKRDMKQLRLKRNAIKQELKNRKLEEC